MAKVKYRKDIFFAFKQLAKNVESIGFIAQNDVDLSPEDVLQFEQQCKEVARKVMELKTKVVTNLKDE